MITCNNNTSWFVIKGIEKKDFESILELLTESEYSQSKMAHNKYEKDISTMYKLKGIYNEDLTITYYKLKKFKYRENHCYYLMKQHQCLVNF
ncbi:type II toxin-antitoxin system RnlA family toxin [Clostridium tertium]|jgi:RNase LS, bacterial toxin|uniref:type II toxin-antitoxin system RnlA family toxin n=1 Tax=Clostridium tertium TaxID=1559 RepID=UPI00232FB9F9|nr:type II toxin-antitoxin system RnlA family toxin [Clostridium tertium]MDB1934010.1 type II toxin-antitoxin system RnlA family toxin [Clostridium tertium]MDB1937115.1 type II toxin-antitoxin system RnlA family toxin [Clostridium tertium]